MLFQAIPRKWHSMLFHVIPSSPDNFMSFHAIPCYSTFLLISFQVIPCYSMIIPSHVIYVIPYNSTLFHGIDFRGDFLKASLPMPHRCPLWLSRAILARRAVFQVLWSPEHRAISSCSTLFHCIALYSILSHTMPSHVIPWYSIVFNTIPCYSMLCYAIPRCSTLFHAITL